MTPASRAASVVGRYTPNAIANEVMAEEAWHDTLWVRASDFDALASSHADLLAALEAAVIAMSAATAHLPVNELPRIACNTAIAQASAVLAKAKGLSPVQGRQK
jgi:hypothetical protein